MDGWKEKIFLMTLFNERKLYSVFLELCQADIEGHNAGLAEGEEKKLIGMICKKLSKRKRTEEIVKEFAEEFEEDAGRVKRICEAAEGFAPEYDCDRIYGRQQEIQKWK